MVIWPEYITLKDWAANLVSDYANEYLPILSNEEKWEEWGAIVAGSGTFSKANVPPPFEIYGARKKSSFKDWREWAKIVYANVNFQAQSGRR
jgi:hypothetical protein